MNPSTPNPNRVLVVDDSDSIQKLIRFRLRQEGLEILSEYEGEPAIARAAADPPDLILLDVGLPNLDGFEVCRRLKENPRTRNVPVIFLTGTSNTESKVRGLDLGAVDYVTKPFDEVELRARVRAALRTKRLQDMLEQQSYLDGLTGLWNRTYLDRRLGGELEVSRRYRRPLSLLMVDIDHFKRLNDSFGHLFGDVVLQAVADALREYARRSDVVTRYGGEEFAILLPDTSQKAALIAGERFRCAIDCLSFDPGGERTTVTVSLGLACVEELGDQLSPAALIECADRALYAAKHQGRNCLFVMTRDGPVAHTETQECWEHMTGSASATRTGG